MDLLFRDASSCYVCGNKLDITSLHMRQTRRKDSAIISNKPESQLKTLKTTHMKWVVLRVFSLRVKVKLWEWKKNSSLAVWFLITPLLELIVWFQEKYQEGLPRHQPVLVCIYCNRSVMFFFMILNLQHFSGGRLAFHSYKGRELISASFSTK